MISFRVSAIESLGSSNNVVKHAIESGEPEGLVVCAYEQTAGYGRLGRSWVSPFGGLYFSLLLRPEVSLSVLPTLGLLVAMTMQQTVRGFLPAGVQDRVQIKWPNDVVLAPENADGAWDTTFQKMCGLSFERHAGGTCIGIGLNVLRPYQEKPVGGKNAPVYVADLMRDSLESAGCPTTVGEQGLTTLQRGVIDRIRHLFLENFASAYDAWCANGFGPFLEEYSRNLCLRGMQVMVVNQVEEQLVSGVVQGVDDQARLLLLTDYGVIEPVVSGEVRLG